MYYKKDIRYPNCFYKGPLKIVRNIFIPNILWKDKLISHCTGEDVKDVKWDAPMLQWSVVNWSLKEQSLCRCISKADNYLYVFYWALQINDFIKDTSWGYLGGPVS